MLFRYNHIPISQPRHRVYKNRMYNPIAKKKKEVRKESILIMREKGFEMLPDVPLEVELILCCPFPKSCSKRKKRALAWKMTKPDGDNYLKFYLDVLSGVAYKDDAQIAAKHVYKIYAEKPGVYVNLIEADDSEANIIIQRVEMWELDLT